MTSTFKTAEAIGQSLEGDSCRDLVVILHGYNGSSAKMRDIRDLAAELVPCAEFVVPDLPYSRLFATARAEAVVAAVLNEVDGICGGPDGTAYRRIWVVAHSSGCVVARKLVLAAFGAAPDIEGGGIRRAWATRVNRLVFIAPVNRGWEPTSALTWRETTLWGLGVLYAEVRHRGRVTVLDFRRGAPFLVETRLQWLKLTRQEPSLLSHLPIVQILGSRDDVVAPDCVVDFEIDNVGGGQTLLLEAPQTGHLDAIELSPTNDSERSAIRERRREAIGKAFGPLNELRQAAIPTDLLDDVLPPKPDPTVDAVVFVMHGIRDRGFWTQKIARQVRLAAGKHGQNVRAETSTYGYFTMLPFLFPWTRRTKVAWFMDRYAALVARYPNARFHFVGHSNGTYLLARALQDYQSARFANVVFAGSVVRSDYDWVGLTTRSVGDKPTRRGEVRRVMNYVASGDFVVAIFPKGLERLRYFDLGGAGHSGFKQSESHPDLVGDVRYIAGSHGAGIRESQWDEIANFVVSGDPPSPSQIVADPDFVRDQKKLASMMGRAAPLPFLLLATVFGLLIPSFVISAAWPPRLSATALLIVGLLVYLRLLRIVVTRY